MNSDQAYERTKIDLIFLDLELLRTEMAIFESKLAAGMMSVEPIIMTQKTNQIFDGESIG